MITTGLDLATEPRKTGMATIRWTDRRTEVVDVRLGVSDDAVIEAAVASTKLGIDCPLGWPDAFVEMLANHHEGHLLPHRGDPAEWRRTLADRATDLAVAQLPGLRPLSVAADRLGLTAMRAANLMGRLAADGTPVDRTGSEVVVEVYPAASLTAWGLAARGYKGTDGTPAPGVLVDTVKAAAPWLDLGKHDEVCRRRDDAFDAVVAALTARAAALALTTPPPDALAERARREGWIAVPTGSLSDLAPGRPHTDDR